MTRARSQAIVRRLHLPVIPPYSPGVNSSSSLHLGEDAMASASGISDQPDNGRTLERSGTLERTAAHSAAVALAGRRETCVAAGSRWTSACVLGRSMLQHILIVNFMHGGSRPHLSS